MTKVLIAAFFANLISLNATERYSFASVGIEGEFMTRMLLVTKSSGSSVLENKDK